MPLSACSIRERDHGELKHIYKNTNTMTSLSELHVSVRQKEKGAFFGLQSCVGSCFLRSSHFSPRGQGSRGRMDAEMYYLLVLSSYSLR